MSEPIKKPNQITPGSYSPKKPEIANVMENAKQLNLKTLPEAFILPDKSTAIPPGIKHYGPAYAAFGNEFSHFLDYSGQGYGFIYEGDWCKDRGYTIADIMTGHAMEPACLFSPEGMDFLWKTAGFSSHHTFYANPEKDDYMSEPDMKEAIKYALCTLEQPVIIPQESRWWGSIVIGYKDNGNVLVIYYYSPYFMDMENNAQPKIEEITGWYNNKTSLFIAGKREKSLSLIDIYREGFRRIRDCLEVNIRGEKRRYYLEWEAFLRMNTTEMIAEVKRTGIVPGGTGGGIVNEEINNENAWKIICGFHESTWCDMAERRYYVMNFIRQAKEYFPELKEDLQALEDHFYYTNEIMGGHDVKGYGSEIGDPINPELFANSEVRARMADCVRRFSEADANGLEMMEKLTT